MTVFRELRSTDIRRINGLTRRMVRCKNLADLERTVVDGALKCVPMDYLGWNIFNRGHTELIYVGANDQLKGRAVELVDEVNNYLVDWHPILLNVGWDGVEKRLATISDFQTVGAFRQAPLYRYVYRHLEADYQAAESVGTYGNFNLTLTYNRRLSDFTRRERQMLHLMNRRLDHVAGELHHREILQARLDNLTPLSGSDRLSVANLTIGEIRALGSLVRGGSIPRDTGASLREKLAVENSKQLVSLVTESIPPQSKDQPG
ncbi:MAG: hypothetical protein JJU20_04335 [Opitutales bacterium]|nr:hypothetical protein [Opitutales bacterium]